MSSAAVVTTKMHDCKIIRSSFFFIACSSSAVGVQNSLAVPDNRFTASTFYSNSYRPQQARLDGSFGWTSTGPGRDTSWLQIDLGDVNVICAVTTQGSGASHDEWTESYKLNLSLSNSDWEYYKEGGTDKVSSL